VKSRGEIEFGKYCIKFSRDWAEEWDSECNDWHYFVTTINGEGLAWGKVKADSLREAKKRSVDNILKRLTKGITAMSDLLYALILIDVDEEEV